MEQPVYPLASSIPQDELDLEIRRLESLSGKPLLLRIPTYFKLGGPGFIGAALSLGAGSLTAAMLSGAQFGYRTLWIVWVAMASGVFMMAAMARFTTKGQYRIIKLQRDRHGWFIGKFLTAIVGIVGVSIIFNFAQVALGTHLLESIANEAGVSFPQSVNWPVYVVLTSWISLNYGRNGRRGVVLVELFMKFSLLVMIMSFLGCLFVVGIDWHAALRGMIVPWLPNGAAGVDLFIASCAAAIGVMDWVFFQYAGLSKGWGPKHENLARFDIVVGMALPFVLVNWIVICVFAATLYGSGNIPSTATELSRALVPLLGEEGGKIAFLVGFLAVPITTSVGMSIACGVAVHEAFDWQPEVSSARWKASVLLPQVAFLGAWMSSPVLLVVVIAAFLSLSTNIVSWSLFLLLNDPTVLGEYRCKSWLWNFGILIQITMLNCVAIMWVFNRFGMWG